MRISDWSSVVCSSDLIMAMFVDPGVTIGVALPDRLVGPLLWAQDGMQFRIQRVVGWRGTTPVDEVPIQVDVVLGGTHDMGKAPWVNRMHQHYLGVARLLSLKTGRASCEDSVCQYVYISVAVVSFKNKK